jgi:hypothetical protein
VTSIAASITSAQWDSLTSFVWTRWGNSPSGILEKILKEFHSRFRGLQGRVFDDWKQREIQLLEKLLRTRDGIEQRVLLFLIEDLLPVRPKEVVPFTLEGGWLQEWLWRARDQMLCNAIARCVVKMISALEYQVFPDLTVSPWRWGAEIDWEGGVGCTVG